MVESVHSEHARSYGAVYPYVKQVTDFVLSDAGTEEEVFSQVVAVEYPRKGALVLGFVTGSGFQNGCRRHRQGDFLTVMVPTSPTPVSGYVIMVPKEETIALDMTVEEAFRFVSQRRRDLPEGEHRIPLPKACEAV